jgi:hypothetical protein
MIHARVIQPRYQVRGAGAGGRDAHAKLAGKFCMGRGHERGHFFMPGLNEFDFFLSPTQRAENAIDTVPRITKNPRYAPLAESLYQKVADCGCHEDPLL